MRFNKNLIFAILANILSTLVSAFVTLLLPKRISTESFGYFQLFLFYVSYVGMLHLGWPDGFYLVKCGEEYNKLNRKKVWGQLVVFFIMQMIISIAVCSASLLFVSDSDKRTVFFLVGIMTVITNVRLFLLYILQATARIKEFSISTIVGLALYIVCVSIFMLLKIDAYEPYIYANMLSVFAPLVVGLYYNKSVLLSGLEPLRVILSETKEYIVAGFKILIANLAGSFIIGVMRWAIEYQWDVTVFGKISLTITVSNLFMTLINAIALVLLPMLRRMKKDKLAPLYSHLNIVLLTSIFAAMMLYYPIQQVLMYWLPDYSDSLVYMSLLLPICVFESKNALILTTYLKTLRKENAIMTINLITLGLSAVLCCISVMLLKNIPLAMFFIIIALAFRCIISELYLSKQMGIPVNEPIIIELMLSAAFIVFNWCIGGWIGLLLYCASIVIYIVLKNKTIKLAYRTVIKG